ncbi:FAD-dependent monooxygenase [Candidatus Pelagibacter sp.]|nr:FAD-dependent monooxygenase [Candidatus Pelagibacter sp.]MDB9986592.1 FAD-dependent monooxygenase [Candidatus Pelagibacter sp.]MDC6468597.1 FAD-dependent monooxygenase [Candidatus Pelagibacter sp.]|tara:strand:+ start:560 stop:1711 length:1152 start_codon:yes stop_codon:yes gene_type:complete
MKKIAIIGAGISGLYIANLLRQNPNYEITVYEKNDSVNLEQGYGIQLSVNSIKLLNIIGFKNINSEEKFHPDKLDFYSLENKKKICDLDISAFNTNEAKYTTLQRFTLINFLKGLVPDNVINFNKKVTQINYETKNIKVIFENDTSIECDYLIISDGTFSTTKSLIANKKINPKYFNSIALRATVNKDNLKEINPDNISLYLGSNLHAVSYPINNGSQFNFVSIFRKRLTAKELSDYSLFENEDFISSVLSTISKQIDPHIIKNLKDIRCFPIFVSTEVYQPTNKNTFLIGDAFFALPPTFAQGASQSIEVAHEIYKNLEGETNKFNNERIKRTKMINIKSKFNYFAFHLSNPLIIWIRNFIMCYLVKNKKFINSYLGKIYKD